MDAAKQGHSISDNHNSASEPPSSSIATSADDFTSASSRNPTQHPPSEPTTRVDPQLDAEFDSAADINIIEGERFARHPPTLQHDSGSNTTPLPLHFRDSKLALTSVRTIPLLNRLQSKLEEAIAEGNLLKKDNQEAPDQEALDFNNEDFSIWGVPLLPSKGGKSTDVLLLKSLCAREFEVKDAFEMLKNTLRWRKETKVDSILDEEDLRDEFGKARFINGLDREGHPVCYNILAVFQDAEMSKIVFGSDEGRKKFLRSRVQLMEQGIKELHMRPGGVSSMLHIPDLKDVIGLSKKEVRDTIKEAVHLLQYNYPEFVARNVIINAPFWYYAFNKIIEEYVLAFDELSEKDTTSWAEISVVYAKKGLVIECLRPFRAMIDSGVEPESVFISWMLLEGVKSNSSTLLSVIYVCSRMAALGLVKCLHGSIKEMSLEFDVTPRTAVSDLKTSRALEESLHPLLRLKPELQEKKLNVAINLLVFELTEIMAREDDHFEKHRRDIQLFGRVLQTIRAGIEFIQMNCLEKLTVIGKNMHHLTNAASSYYTVFAENKKLYNQVRDLKVSIWVYCRVRPFFPGQMNSNIVNMHQRRKIFDPGGLLSPSGQRASTESRSFDAWGV